MRLALVVGLLGLASPVFAADKAPATAKPGNAAKLDKIRKLLKATHADAPLHQLMDAAKAQMTPTQYAEFEKQVKVDEILELVVSAYDRHFTDQDIDGLLAFYETPLGKKMVQEGPAIQKESAELTQQYVIEKLKNLQQSQQKSPAPGDVPAKSP